MQAGVESPARKTKRAQNRRRKRRREHAAPLRIDPLAGDDEHHRFLRELKAGAEELTDRPLSDQPFARELAARFIDRLKQIQIRLCNSCYERRPDEHPYADDQCPLCDKDKSKRERSCFFRKGSPLNPPPDLADGSHPMYGLTKVRAPSLFLSACRVDCPLLLC